MLKKEAMGDAWVDEAEAFGDSDPNSRPTTPNASKRKVESQVLMLSPLGPNDQGAAAEGAATPLSGGKPKGSKAFPDGGEDEPAEGEEVRRNSAPPARLLLDRLHSVLHSTHSRRTTVAPGRRGDAG